MYRKRIQSELGWNNYQYKKIEQVCNSLSWNRSMKQSRLSSEDWQAIKEKYNFTCGKCGKQEPEITLEPDRVWPGALGGSYDPENVQCLCRGCNASKNAQIIDFRTEQRKLRSNTYAQ